MYHELRKLEQDIIKKVNKTGHFPLPLVSQKSIKRPLRDFLNGAML